MIRRLLLVVSLLLCLPASARTEVDDEAWRSHVDLALSSLELGLDTMRIRVEGLEKQNRELRLEALSSSAEKGEDNRAREEIKELRIQIDQLQRKVEQLRKRLAAPN